MNNTTRRNLALVSVFMAATLVVGTLATTTNTIATTTQSAFAYSKKDNGKGNDNGNTVTIEECKNRGSASGFDTALDQECENLICTHPGENATCVQEGVRSAVAPIPTPVKNTCEQCFTTLLTPQQISNVLAQFSSEIASLPDLCTKVLEQGVISEETFRAVLRASGVSETTANDLIACLLKAGIVFPIE
jgi:hypothetical protein